MHRDGKNSTFTAIFHHIAMHSTELSHEAPHALKGQKLLAQGSALGILAISKAPCKVGCSKSESKSGIKNGVI